MMKNYNSCLKESIFEQEISKSKFIGYVFPVESVESANAYILKIRKKHSDATHNCFAYILDENMNTKKFSDDGEPQGTAGMPILEVISKQGLTNVLVVVTRYFGGIKLGAGGLVRAYSTTASGALNLAEKCQYRMSNFFQMQISYDLYNKIQKQLEIVRTLKTAFYANVQIDFVSDDDEIVQKLTNLCDGKCSIKFIKKQYYQYKI